jgi:hypothetical protein
MTKAKTLSWVAALCVTGLGAYAFADEPKSAAACGSECPMHQAAELSTIKVEQTKQGAVIQLIAKKPEDVAKVQQSAQQMAAMLSSGACPMHAAHGGGMHHMHGHEQDEHHEHHEHQQKQSAPPAASPK